MPRRREVPKREVLPDPLYGSQLVTKFVNVVMRQGKKTVAERILYDALDTVKERTSDDPVKVFKRAIENVKPSVEVRSRRVGGATWMGAVGGSGTGRETGPDGRISAGGPARTIRPSSIHSTRSAFRAASRSWVITNVVRPCVSRPRAAVTRM